ncbi:MAG: tail protein X [Lachnospiraceae bacterium]
MADTYTTIQGDTWDYIAFKVYGSESYTTFLMEHNYPYLDILIFSSGTILNTPPLPEEEKGELPPWRNNLEEEDFDPYDEEEDEVGT